MYSNENRVITKLTRFTLNSFICMHRAEKKLFTSAQSQESKSSHGTSGKNNRVSHYLFLIIPWPKNNNVLFIRFSVLLWQKKSLSAFKCHNWTKGNWAQVVGRNCHPWSSIVFTFSLQSFSGNLTKEKVSVKGEKGQGKGARSNQRQEKKKRLSVLEPSLQKNAAAAFAHTEVQMQYILARSFRRA